MLLPGCLTVESTCLWLLEPHEASFIEISSCSSDEEILAAISIHIDPMALASVPVVVYVVSNSDSPVSLMNVFLILNHQIDMSRVSTSDHESIWHAKHMIFWENIVRYFCCPVGRGPLIRSRVERDWDQAGNISISNSLAEVWNHTEATSLSSPVFSLRDEHKGLIPELVNCEVGGVWPLDLTDRFEVDVTDWARLLSHVADW